MSQRRLKRQLGLLEAVMLGTAGTIGAEIFVLTGHIAGLAGPASILALALVGVLGYAVALNYCEMGTAFPETGGALTYVREAYGPGLLAFLVGSLDCLSSTFFAALSAVAFSYSLQIFIPDVPIIPVAIVVVAGFTLINALGVNNVGRAQVLLGAILLALLAAYVAVGLAWPKGGFSWAVFAPEGRFFVHKGAWSNVGWLLATMGLSFNAYIGYELIADDAEEMRDPNRTIPLAILISLTVVIIVTVLVGLVTLGIVPWSELVGSETALATAAARVIPFWGPLLVGVAGIIATLTTVNTAMLSATREAFSLSRHGQWPRFLSRLGRTRNPVVASLTVGAVVALVATIGLVDFLGYISSSGYLFVVFWATLSMMKLRRDRPALLRPYKVPLYPLTPIIAAALCVLVVAFTAWRPLLFGAALLGVLSVFYWLQKPVAALIARRAADPAHAAAHERDRILVAVSNPRTAEGLAGLALALARRTDNMSVLSLRIVPAKYAMLPAVAQRFLERAGQHQRALLSQVAAEMEASNVPFYTRTYYAKDVAEGILREVRHYGNDKLILMGWPGPLTPETLAQHPVRRVLQDAPTNVAVFLDRGLPRIRSILVPVGGSHHSRLALRLALELADSVDAEVTAVRCFCSGGDSDAMHDELMMMREMIETEFGEVPPELATRVVAAPTVLEGIQSEIKGHHYDLVVMGAALAYSVQADLFGSLSDQVATHIPCSVLLVRRHEPVVLTWLRRRVHQWVGA